MLTRSNATSSHVISHIRRLPDQTWEIQTNEQHQQGIADLAAEFASHSLSFSPSSTP